MSKLSRSTLLLICLVCGCGRGTDNAPVWALQAQTHAGLELSLGYRRDTSGNETRLEPVAKLSQAKQPVANAMIFVTLLAADGTSIGSEAATVYDAAADPAAGVYRAESFDLPATPPASKLRFRIVLPDQHEPWVEEIDVTKLPK